MAAASTANGGGKEVGGRRVGIFVARHGERIDYQWRERGDNWQSQADRPWDTPLTPAGHKQGAALGRSIKRQCEELGLPPVRRVVSSPLLRCVQTATEAAISLGVPQVGIEAGAAETMCEEWYRSWAVPGADATWGGHAGAEVGTPTAKEDLHASALGPASDCHRSALELKELKGVNFSEGGLVTVDTQFQSCAPRFEYKWGEFESEEAASQRMKQVVEYLVKSVKMGDSRGVGTEGPPVKRQRKSIKGDEAGDMDGQKSENDGREEDEDGVEAKVAEEEDGSILLISHGGPTSHLYTTLTGEKRTPPCGYCGLFCYVESSASSGWDALIVANHDHLKEVPEGTMSGPNDMQEQKS